MRTMFLISVLLLSTIWVNAQHRGDKDTLVGCVSESSGAYSMTDKKSEGIYEITSDKPLRPYVGHEVRAQGIHTSPWARLGGVPSSNPLGGVPTFNVQSVTVLGTCKKH